MSDTTPQCTGSDEAAIRAVEADYDAAWNAGDVGSAARLFTSDAVVVNPSGGVSSGIGEIRESLGALLSGVGRGSTHSSQILAVRLVASDVAIVDGEATIEGFGHAKSRLRHRFTDVLVHQGGEWRITQVRAYVFMPPPDA